MTHTPHPLEAVFDLIPGSTPTTTAPEPMELIDPTTGEVVPRKTEGQSDPELEKEERIEDIKIDQQLDGIHTSALEAFQTQYRLSQEVDPKFSARNAEVAAQYLKIALDTVSTRTDAKYKRNKIKIAKNAGPRQVQNNLVLADRNSVLASLFNQEKTIEESK